MKVEITEYKGIVIINAVNPEKDDDFIPAGEGKIGCTLMNTREHLGISKEALDIMRNYRCSGDDLGEIMAWTTSDGRHCFGWLGGTKRLVGKYAELDRNGWTDIDHKTIPNSPPQEAVEAIDSAEKQVKEELEKEDK